MLHDHRLAHGGLDALVEILADSGLGELDIEQLTLTLPNKKGHLEGNSVQRWHTAIEMADAAKGGPQIDELVKRVRVRLGDHYAVAHLDAWLLHGGLHTHVQAIRTVLVDQLGFLRTYPDPSTHGAAAACEQIHERLQGLAECLDADDAAAEVFATDDRAEQLRQAQLAVRRAAAANDELLVGIRSVSDILTRASARGREEDIFQTRQTVVHVLLAARMDVEEHLSALIARLRAATPDPFFQTSSSVDWVRIFGVPGQLIASVSSPTAAKKFGSSKRTDTAK